MLDRLIRLYASGAITLEHVDRAVSLGWITMADAETIVGPQ